MSQQANNEQTQAQNEEVLLDTAIPKYSSYLDILGAENPEAAFAEIANDPVVVMDFLRQSEFAVAEAGVELELWRRSDEEKESFTGKLGRHEAFLRLKLKHEIGSMRGSKTEGQIKQYVADEVLTSQESIITLENEMRLRRSWADRLLERSAATKLGRFAVKTAIAGGLTYGTYMATKYGTEFLPRDAEELVREHTTPESLAVLAGLVSSNFIFRHAGDKLSERGQDAVDDYTPRGFTRAQRKLYQKHHEQMVETRHLLHEIVATKFFADDAHSDEMLTAMLGVLHDSLMSDYAQTKSEALSKQGIKGVGKAIGAGAVTSLGVNERAAEQLFDVLPLK